MGRCQGRGKGSPRATGSWTGLLNHLPILPKRLALDPFSGILRLWVEPRRVHTLLTVGGNGVVARRALPRTHGLGLARRQELFFHRVRRKIVIPSTTSVASDSAITLPFKIAFGMSFLHFDLLGIRAVAILACPICHPLRNITSHRRPHFCRVSSYSPVGIADRHARLRPPPPLPRPRRRSLDSRS